MPTSEAETVVAVPLVVREPMMLLAMTTVPLLDEPMPKLVPPLLEVVKAMEPVPVPLPMVLPVTVPTFTLPFPKKMPVNTPGIKSLVAELVHTMLLMVLPCTLLGVVLPTLLRWMPTNR